VERRGLLKSTLGGRAEEASVKMKMKKKIIILKTSVADAFLIIA
jgi:hypothetical protein